MPNLATTGEVRLHSVVGASPQPSVFTPSDLANGVDWYNAADTASITHVANSVSQFNGQLGVHNLTQGTGGIQPQTGGSVNGHNALTFGASQRIDKTGLSSIAQPLTMWGVLAVDSTAGRRDLMAMGGFQPLMTSRLSGTKWNAYAGSTVSTAADSDTSLHLLIWVFNGASSAIHVDGTSDTGLNPGTSAGGNLVLGDNSGSSLSGMTFCAGGWTSGAMSAGDRTSLRTWAQSYWGTP